MKKVTDRGKRSKALNEVKPVKSKIRIHRGGWSTNATDAPSPQVKLISELVKKDLLMFLFKN